MLLLTLNITSLICLVLIFIQDLKYRHIHIMLPVILFGVGILQHILLKYSLIILLPSILFLTITLLAGYLFISLKNKQVINPFKSIIGIGDIIYFIAILPFFITKNYILYFITGMLFSLLSFIVYKTFNNNIKTVPLAGLLAFYFICLKVISYSFNDFNFFIPIL